MRFNYIVLLILFLTACASNEIKQPIAEPYKPLEIQQPPIDIEKLELRDDSYYENGKIEPYSGIAYRKYLYKHDKDSGTVLSGRIISGKKQGIWELRFISKGEIWSDYIVATLQYKDGMVNGQKTFYRVDGTISGREKYKNGVQDGLSISFHDNGQLKYRGFFKEGKRHGEESEYFDNGQLKYSSTYKNGVLTDNGESLLFFKNGQIESKSILKDGVRNGAYIIYFPDGKIKIKTNFINGVEEGRAVTYYENGTVKSMREHRDGELNGSSVNYREDGSLEARVYYKNGEIVKADFYDYEGNFEFSK